MTPVRLPSPPGHLLVVDNNLQEAFGETDRSESHDLANFARRVAEVVPYAPDALLLQEVVGPTVRRSAEYLTDALGTEYAVGAAPGDAAHRRSGRRGERFVRDTAVVVNTATMGPITARGFVTAPYSARHTERANVDVRENAWVTVADRRNGGHVVLMSVHLVPPSWFVSEDVARVYGVRWARKFAVSMAGGYAPRLDPVTHVIAGDFNIRRCRDAAESVDCEPAPFWSLLHGFGYRDAVFEVGRQGEIGTQKRIDYIFTDATVVDAASDLAYSAEDRRDRGRHYSDHRLVWALLDRGG